MLASVLVKEGKHAAAFPMFASERRGTPVTASLGIDEKPIREKTQIYEPDCLIVVDPDLIKGHVQEIFNGPRPGSILVLNAPRQLKGYIHRM
jgi:2-oxoisovalerate ferredoxin oxidoreductase gamma subunit